MKIRQFIWERLRGPFVSGNEHVECPETFHEELNDQCGRIIFVAALIAIFAWLPYILIDRQLYPDEPLVVALRIGLSLAGLTFLVLQFFKRFYRYNLLFLIIIAAYLEIATGLITGLVKADPAYLGGYLLALTLLALVPIPRREAWSILAVSLLIFFTVGFAKGMHFDSVRSRYGLNDLLVTVLVVAFFIYLLDRLRFNSWENRFKGWEKSKKIEQQNEALRRSEEQYRLLAENSDDVIWTTDTEMRFTYISPSSMKLRNVPVEEAMQEKLDEIMTQESLNRVLAEYNRALPEIEQGKNPALRIEIEQYRKDRSTLWVEISTKTIRDNNGRLSGFLGVSRDISHRKKAEEVLRESEDRLRAIIEGTQALLVSVDADGRLTYANDATAEALGYKTAAEIIGRLYLDFVHSDDRRRVLNSMIHQAEASQPSSIQEFRVVDTECQVKWFSFVSTLIIKDGKFVGMTGVAQNITERKQAEDARRESEARYRTLFDQAAVGVAEIEHFTGRFLTANRRLCKLLGRTEEEMRDTTFQAITHPDDLHLHEDKAEQLLARTIDHYTLEKRYISKDGAVIWVNITVSDPRETCETHGRNIVIVEDINERMRVEEAMRRSEEKYRLLAENSNDVIWTTDKELRYTYYSPAVRKLRGLEPEEAIAKTLAETVTPASLNALVSEYKRQLPDIEKGLNPTAVIEIEEYRKDGSTIWVEVSMTTMRDDRGILTGYVGVTRDISARKLAEEERQLRNILLSTQQEVSIDGILVVDENGTMISFNRRFVEIWAISSDVVESKSDERALQSVMGNLVDPDEFIAKVRHLYENRAENSRDEIALKDGRILDRYSAPMLGDDGKYYGRIWYFRDITERKRTEAALQASEEKFRQIVSSIPYAVSMLDMNLRFTYMSAGVQRILGYAPEEAIALSLDQIFTPESLAIVGKSFQERLEANARGSDPNYVLILELEQYHKNGSTVFLENTMTFLRDANGVPVGILCVSADITERKRAEAALQASKDAADAANRSKSIFLANMSHEIRTPMNAILGFAQLMQRDPKLSEQSREHLDIINRSGEHLLALINDILEMSKIEAGRATFVPSTFDLHSLLSDLEMMFRVRTDAKKLRFLSEKVGDVPRWVITDEGKLRQVLINILGNAVKFTDEGGIALRLRAETGKGDTVDLQFEVEDTGPGMAEEEIGRLFQAFEQTKTGIKSGGTGLGLALSQGFVKIMGGSISVASTIGKGTTLRFEIPVREGKEEQAPPKEAKRHVLGLRPGQSEIRVLVADDRETNRQLLSQLLVAVGFPIREVVNGAEAVRMVHEWKPQVVLMDMTMPVMDGYEATRTIKASPDIKNTAIIAVTASAFEEDKQRVLAAGAEGYLSKPFKEAELFETIGRLTGADYLYEETGGGEKASKAVDDVAVMRKSVAALPSELVGQLRNAVESADLDRLNDLAAQLITDHPTLAQWMQEMAARYEYEALIELFSSGV